MLELLTPTVINSYYIPLIMSSDDIFFDQETLGKRLLEERKRLDMTQEEFGSAAGVRRPTQYLYEKGERTPSIEYLSRITMKGVDFRYLLTGERSVASGGKICLEPELLQKIFSLVDEICRDSRGRLLEREYRSALMLSISRAVAETPLDEIDWEALRYYESA